MVRKARPYIGVFFRCCGVYQRIYLTERGDRYVGFCPRCSGKIVVKVDPSGTEDRFFEGR